MAETEDDYRGALITHHRRAVRASMPAGSLWLPASLSWRVRQARRTGDPYAWVAVGLTVASPVLTSLVNDRRAEQRADDDLDREARRREHQRRARAGEQVSVLSDLPAGQTPLGCQLQSGIFAAGLAQATWDYFQRPDRGRRVVGRAWRWRPGPAWWTAWSFQQLPVNAASTAPRASQIAYQRRQLITLRSTLLASVAISTWETQLRRGLTDRDTLRVAAGTSKLATEIARGVADYRLVPDTVDTQRARRRHHERTVAALFAARATGLPGPANPWWAEMLLTAAAAASMGSIAAISVVSQSAFTGTPRRSEVPTPSPGGGRSPGHAGCRGTS